MTSKKLYGLNKYFLEFVSLFDMGKIPKVLMLTGKKGQGKFTLVHHLLSYIFDNKNYDLKNTTINNSNKLFNNIKENYNPDIVYYKCKNNDVKIDDIRSLRINLQKSSISESKRFIIFDDIEYLNTNCVNALLKTIEEPSEINHFILINNKGQNLLETLKSRSIEIMFFLNNIEKISIIEKIISDFQLEKKIDLSNSTLTPGNYLKFNKLILDEKIDISDKLIVNIKKLLTLNKFKKNIDYLNLTIYLINQYYFKKSKNEQDINYYNNKRVDIIKKLDESNKLNLNHVNLITELENYI